jgi:hypothetical protein
LDVQIGFLKRPNYGFVYHNNFDYFFRSFAFQIILNHKHFGAGFCIFVIVLDGVG